MKEMDTNPQALDQIDMTRELLNILLQRTCLMYKSKNQYVKINKGKMLWWFAWEMTPLVLDIGTTCSSVDKDICRCVGGGFRCCSLAGELSYWVQALSLKSLACFHFVLSLLYACGSRGGFLPSYSFLHAWCLLLGCPHCH